MPEGHIPILNSLAVPIIHRKRAIGLLHVANKEAGYDDSDQRLLETIAGHVAPILHARLQSERREEQLRQHRNLLGTVEKRTAELRSANKQLLKQVNERKEVEQSLRESEERFSKAFHCAPIPTSISRISDGLVLDVNSSLLELLGRSATRLSAERRWK